MVEVVTAMAEVAEEMVKVAVREKVVDTGDTYGNMKDLNFIIDGNDKGSPMGDLFHLHDIPSTDDGSMSSNLVNSVVSLRIDRGAMSHAYESIGLTLISECEWMLSRDQLYRAPISHTAYLGDIKWEKKCPSVTWDEGTWNTYANYIASTETSNLFNVTLMNPDPMNLWSNDHIDGDTEGTNHLVHENVEFVRLQFRRPGTGEWIRAWNAGTTDSADLQCSSSSSSSSSSPSRRISREEDALFLVIAGGGGRLCFWSSLLRVNAL